MMVKHELSVYVEEGSFNLGYVGGKYNEEELRSYLKGKNRETLSEMLKNLHEYYGKKINLSIHDPRNISSLPADIKHNIKLSEPTWILDGKKIFEGIPEWEDIKNELEKVIS